MVKQLAHLCIFTQDLDATAAFYTEGLGLTQQFDFVRHNEPFGYYLKLGNHSFIEVFKGDPGPVGNINHVAIEVEDIDAVIQRLHDYGYEVGDKRLGGDYSWQAWTTDPNGVRIEFHQYTEQSMQLVGGTCIADW
ncbi:MAG: VOC family protein [Planctomycetota bacterium]